MAGEFEKSKENQKIRLGRGGLFWDFSTSLIVPSGAYWSSVWRWSFGTLGLLGLVWVLGGGCRFRAWFFYGGWPSNLVLVVSPDWPASTDPQAGSSTRTHPTPESAPRSGTHAQPQSRPQGPKYPTPRSRRNLYWERKCQLAIWGRNSRRPRRPTFIWLGY